MNQIQMWLQNNMQFILTVIGVVFMITIVTWNQLRYRKKRLQYRTAMQEPVLTNTKEEVVNNLVECSAEPITAATSTDQLSANLAAPKLIVVYCVADLDRPYMGYELLQSILASGLRFGAQNVFHRHAKANARGVALFSLASAHEPGTFDIQKMGSVVCRGLCFYMQLADEEHNTGALDLMLTTAYQLTQDLGGRLLDADRSEFNSDIYQDYRDIVERFQRERMIG